MSPIWRCGWPRGAAAARLKVSVWCLSKASLRRISKSARCWDATGCYSVAAGDSFCGGKRLIALLLRRSSGLRLHPAAAARQEVACFARFVDGTEVGPVGIRSNCAVHPVWPRWRAFQITALAAQPAWDMRQAAGEHEQCVGASAASPMQAGTRRFSRISRRYASAWSPKWALKRHGRMRRCGPQEKTSAEVSGITIRRVSRIAMRLPVGCCCSSA